MDLRRDLYLDANSTAQLRPEAIEAVTNLLAMAHQWSNASTVHERGRKSRFLLEQSRAQVLGLFFSGVLKHRLRDLPGKLFFTSGGTEACNSLLRCFVGRRKGAIAISAIEHPAIGRTAQSLESEGWRVITVYPDSRGVVDVEEFCHAVVVGSGQQVELASLMLANNETGALQPVAELARSLRSRGFRGVITSDISQAVGKSRLSLSELFDAGVDAVAFSAHKLGALAGVGAVIVSNKLCLDFQPLIYGGGQESGFRSGTENLPSIVAFGAVCEKLAGTIGEELRRRRELTQRFWREVSGVLPDTCSLTPGTGAVGGGVECGLDQSACAESEDAIVNTLLLRFPGCRADDLVVALDIAGVRVSTSSACQSGKQGVSYVLQALQRNMPLGDDAAREYVRFSTDWDIDEELVSAAAERVVKVVRTMRGAAR